MRTTMVLCAYIICLSIDCLTKTQGGIGFLDNKINLVLVGMLFVIALVGDWTDYLSNK